MRYRKRIRRGRSGRIFRRTASRVHRKNLRRRIMRGGYRL